MIKKSNIAEDINLEKLVYTDQEVQEMFGFNKFKMRQIRSKGLIAFLNTRPIKYTRKMIRDFVSYIDANPESITNQFLLKK
jgi:phytoene/squalene synthetase